MDLATLADPAREQYFLTNPVKVELLVAAGGVRPTDDVVEIGAGVGTVARHIPTCRSLTVVELDERLIPTLQSAVPHARAIAMDALPLVQELPVDVLYANLPNVVTERLLDVLDLVPFRAAVLAVGEHSDVAGRLGDDFRVVELTTVTGTDFTPPQPSVSRLVAVYPVSVCA